MARIEDYHNDLPFETRIKMKKNVVYIAMFSVIMVFAGLTSAYVVSMGGSFWIKFPLPIAFYISTALIALSSVAYILAVKALGKSIKKVRAFIILAFLLGVGFCISQFQGYKELSDEGAYVVGTVTVVDGRYGDYYEVKYKDNFVDVDGNDYLVNGKILTSEQIKAMQAYFKHFENIQITQTPHFSNLDPNFTLYYKDEPLQLSNGNFIRPNGQSLQTADLERLRTLSWNIKEGRGDFVHKGKFGKDFKIYLKGKELQYKDRNLYYQGKKLSVPLQNKLTETKDNATSYIYIITFLHLLHILVALIYLARMVYISFTDDFDERRALSIKLGGIFWHFLGGLWLYLLLFLLFIH